LNAQFSGQFFYSLRLTTRFGITLEIVFNLFSCVWNKGLGFYNLREKEKAEKRFTTEITEALRYTEKRYRRVHINLIGYNVALKILQKGMK